MGKHPPTNKWCFLRSNGLLRQLIISKKDELNLSLYDIEKETGINHFILRDYLGGKENGISQYNLYKLALFLGYELRLDITVKIPGK